MSLSALAVHFGPAIDESNGSGRAGLRNLRGGFLVEIMGCFLGVSGCGKYGAIVVLENLQPSRDIRCVFYASFLVQFEIGEQESRP